MGSRRFKPLIVSVLALTVVLFARLYQIQVHEHRIWASEAVNLVRSSAVVPHVRGAIVDRKGRPLVRDEQIYRVQFRYRDFRRGHPLGQVAHAWSSLALEPIPLPLAFDHLVEVGLELVQLTHAELDAFAEDGEGLERGLLAVGPAVEGRDEYRLTRRADLRFYISRLLKLDRRELLEAVREKDVYPSLLDYASRPESGRDRQRLLEQLRHDLERSRQDLGRLAELLFEGDLVTLVDQLEQWRQDVEDSTASELFKEAAGFPVGRAAPQTIATYVDLDWLAVLLRWDRPRREEWLIRAREQWKAAFREYHLKVLRVELETSGDGQLGRPDSLPAIVTEFWAERFLGQVEGAHPLEIFEELDSLFELSIPRDQRANNLRVLPFEEPGVRWGRDATFEDLAKLELWSLQLGSGHYQNPAEAEPTPAEVAQRASEWRAANRERADLDWVAERTAAVVAALELRVQQMLRWQLARLAGDGAQRGRLLISEGRLDRAEERAQSVLKDRGSRPFEIPGEQDYTLIHLVTRYPEAFAGFGARESTKRHRETFVRAGGEQSNVSEDRRIHYAERLIGQVRTPDLKEMLAQRPLEEKLELLQHSAEAGEAQISELVREIRLVDEQLGSDGVEGLFEAELSGANGYRSRRGMQDLLGKSGQFYSEPQDGDELVLTLDRELQRAAQDVLANPAEAPEVKDRDYTWLRRPTGAIVLARVNGDVLAAASFPDEERLDDFGQPSASSRDWNLERTLRVHRFQPPGSVFKPFVAAWALDRIGLDGSVEMVCGPRSQGPGAGYESMRCHKEYGHGHIGLHDALVGSCNAYFAWVGEQLTERNFQDLAAMFGFGQRTGVRYEPDRRGLAEDTGAGLFRGLDIKMLRQAGNGLSVINATPMQVARGYAGLATGQLPEMRLVDRAGGRQLERRSRPVPLSEAALAEVRAALSDVTRMTQGSGYKALRKSELGFDMSAKTGSADLSNRLVQAPDGKLRVRKHTWVAGWFPPEDPVAVVVIFIDDTLMTASRGAVWVAQQFLTHPEVERFLREEGVIR